MMATLSLAARNLLRNRRRSLATVLAVALGSASILLFGGYSANIRYSMETAYARTGGHLQIQHRDFLLYGNGNPTAYGIKDGAKLLAAIRGDEILRDMVVVATPTLQFGGIAGNYAAGVSRTVVGLGLVAQDHSLMREWNHYGIPLISPPFKLTGSRPEAAIIGVGVARVLQLCAELKIADCPAPAKEDVTTGAAMPSDIALLTAAESTNNAKNNAKTKAAAPAASATRIELLASTARGTPNVASLEVIDAEGQGFKELDEVYIAVHLAQAQRLVFGAAAPQVTAVMVQLKRPDMLPAARDTALSSPSFCPAFLHSTVRSSAERRTVMKPGDVPSHDPLSFFSSHLTPSTALPSSPLLVSANCCVSLPVIVAQPDATTVTAAANTHFEKFIISPLEFNYLH